MENTPGEPAPLDKEELLKKHRQEKKDLQSKIQSMKKSIPKGDKKKKNEITDEIAKLENELEDKHSRELSEYDDAIQNTIPKEPGTQNESDQEETEKAPLKISRTQKRRNKKEAESKEAMENTPGEPASLDKEELLCKHRQEKKDLQSKIQSMKKGIPKGDKKKKKEITDEITKLENELEDKHSQQLSEYEAPIQNTITKELGTKNESDQDETDKAPLKLSRAQKRRNKKETEAKEREKRITDQAERNKEGPRFIEMSSIKKSLKEISLQIHNIPADGNCLYLAINHQLQISGRHTFTVNEMRKKTANFMRNNKDDFLPFMYNEDDESEVISEEAFDSYCKEVEKTKLWGGQLELKALSNILACPIKVIQATGPPTVQGEHFKNPELTLTYHRHLYRLGEHYNSTLPLVEEDSV